MNDEGLEVRGTLGEQLTSVDGRTSDNWRVIADASTENRVVRGLVAGAEEVVSNATDVDLYERLAGKQGDMGERLYGSKRKNTADLVSNSLVHDVPDSVVLVEVGRTLRNVDAGRNDTAGSRTSEELVSDVDEVVKGSRVSAGCSTTSGTLKMVEATTRLATRTPHTTSGSGHDDVREWEVAEEEDF